MSNWLKRILEYTGSGSICLDSIGFKDPEAAEAWPVGCKVSLPHSAHHASEARGKRPAEAEFHHEDTCEAAGSGAGGHASALQQQSMWLAWLQQQSRCDHLPLSARQCLQLCLKEASPPHDRLPCHCWLLTDQACIASGEPEAIWGLQCDSQRLILQLEQVLQSSGVKAPMAPLALPSGCA